MMKNKARRYLIFTKASILETMSYKAQIWLWTICGLLPLVINCLLWTTVYKYDGTGSINGFTLNEMLTYVICMAFTSQVLNDSPSFDYLANDIYKGDLAIRIIKPISYKLQMTFSALGNYIADILLRIIPMMIVAFIILYFGWGIQPPAWYNVILYFISLFLGLMVVECFDFMFATLAFYTGSMWGLYMTKNVIQSFLSGVLIPISFFPGVFETILKFLPFSSMASTPNMILLGRLNITEILLSFALQISWWIILYFVSTRTYNSLVKKAVQAGG